ncbi:MAG: hypothetical protein K2K81_07350 [Muribaculaceae bacterium]|nr:hypothetical protein [Muribaculaceae bacterium]
MTNKEIRYTGHTAVPSDYDSPDGDLTLSLNLLNEESSLRPIPAPRHLFTLPEEFRILCIHNPSPSVRNYIVAHPFDDGSTDILFIPASALPDTASPEENSLTADMCLSSHHHRICTLYHPVTGCKAIGNILILLSRESIGYCILNTDQDTYSFLGYHIPEISVDFALASSTNIFSNSKNYNIELHVADDNQKKYVLQLTGFFSSSHPGGETLRQPYVTTAEGKAFNNALSNALYAILNKYIKDSTDKGQFVQPFFIRYAYKLFDGSYTMHSAPILMIPNSQAPTIQCESISFSEETAKIINKIACVSCSLLFRINSDLTELMKWKDIVTSLDIFVTPQIYTFNQDGEVSLAHRTSQSQTYPVFRHYGTINDLPTRGDENRDYHRHSSGSVSSDEPSYSLFSNTEHQEDFTNHIWNYSKKSIKDIEAGIRDASQFYRIASIDIENLEKTDKFKIVDPEKTLTTIHQQPLLKDDYDSHASLLATCALEYNARLTLADVSIIPFSGFSLPDMTQFSEGAPDTSEWKEDITIYVKIKRGNMSVWVQSEERTTYSPALQFPRYLFYPDANAKEMILATTKGYWHLHLTTHDFLNGSYWFRGLGSDSPEFLLGSLPEEISEASTVSQTIPVKNKVYVSEVNNPFYFPVTNIVSVGASQVMAISSAARPLSQGQFGQFPLYAFALNGVWALEVSATGVINARQPITRDICINPSAITQIDSAVLFPTDRGIMLLSGSQAQCITDSIASEHPFPISSLPSLQEAIRSASRLSPGVESGARLSPGVDSLPQLLPFSRFLKDCGIIYDYIHQRIILYNPSIPYAYIHSLRSRQWGMIESAIESTINFYPEAMATERDGAIVDFSRESTEYHPQFLITRPIKLGAPDLLKTVRTMIQRGYFAKGHIKSVLYASRNLIDWHLVSSSRGEAIRAFSGTPYKYFRIALICSLDRGESLSGATIGLVPRFTNHLR